ncbi:MAG: hypothetical protein F6J93_33060 [Oscillatoria sp. SIO1A7]|nr:hypothetical protein [Oscillatoria sp. SIO1A7]
MASENSKLRLARTQNSGALELKTQNYPFPLVPHTPHPKPHTPHPTPQTPPPPPPTPPPTPQTPKPKPQTPSHTTTDPQTKKQE